MRRPQYFIHMGFPKGRRSTPEARRRLELAARDQLRSDFEKDGYEMSDISFRCKWESDGINGIAIACGIAKDSDQ